MTTVRSSRFWRVLLTVTIIVGGLDFLTCLWALRADNHPIIVLCVIVAAIGLCFAVWLPRWARSSSTGPRR